MRFAVVNGAIASGRTTVAIQLAKELDGRGLKTAVLANEEGLDSLSGKFAEAQGVLSVPMLGGCIGSQRDNLIAELRRLRDQKGVTVVIAEMPAVCACSPDHVYAPLRSKCKDEFDYAPLVTVMTGREVQGMIDDDPSDKRQHGVNYLHSEHLKSGDVILLNKADLLSSEQLSRYEGFLGQQCEGKPVITGSALDTQTIRALADSILEGQAGFRFISKGMDKKLFEVGEENFSTYNQRICLTGREGATVDFEGFGSDLLAGIRDAAQAANGEMKQTTLLGEFPSRTVKDAGALVETAGMPDIDRPLTLKEPHESLRMAIRVRHTGQSQRMLREMMALVDALAEKWGYDLEVFLVESFTVPDYTSRRYMLLKRNDHDKFNEPQ